MESRGFKTIVTCSAININIDDVTVAKLSTDLKYLAVLMRDGSLRVISHNRSVCIAWTPAALKTLVWHSGGEYNRLVAHTEDDKLVFYSVSTCSKRLGSSEFCASFDGGHSLTAYTDCPSSVRLLDYRKDVATFFVNRYVASIPRQGQEWEKHFNITERGDICTDGLQIVRPYFFILWTSGVLDGYDLISRTLKVTIDLSLCCRRTSPNVLPSFSTLSRFLVTSDLEYVIHCDQSGQLIFISLRHWLAELQIDCLEKGSSQKYSDLWKKGRSKRVSGFDKDKNRDVESSRDPTVRYLTYKSTSVMAFKGSASSIILWEPEKELHGTIVVIDLKTLSPKLILNLDEPSFVILAENNLSPHLILTSSKLSALVYDETPEDMISKFMTHDASGAAAHVARLNDWKSIFIPTKVLSMCLQKRQLEAISFYLKNHEFDRETIINFTSKEVAHLQSVLLLLKSSIQECLSDMSLRSFGERLLQVSLGYLIRLLKSVVIANNDIIVNVIMDNLNEIRSLMENYPKSLEVSDDSSSDVPQLWKEWLHLDKLNIIRSGLQNKCLPLVQTFFLHNSFEDLDFAVSEFPLSGLQLVIDQLNNGDVAKAILELNNMEVDAKEKLKHIYFHTTNRRLRKTIEDYYAASEWLTETETQAVTRLQLLEEMYPCQSIITTLEMLNNLKSWGDEEFIYLSILFGSPENRSSSNRRDAKLAETGEAEICNNFNYSCVLLNWTCNWKQETWGRVIMESLVRRPDAKYAELVNSRLAWDYLIQHNRFDIMSNWLSSILDSNLDNSCALQCFLPTVISQEMIEGLKRLVSHSSSSLLDQLARSGIFSDGEIGDLPVLLKRLGQICTYGDQMSALLSNSSQLSPEVFHTRFLRYCIDQDMPYVLWNHVDQFGIPMDFLNADNLEAAVTWLPVVVRFKYWADNPDDVSLVYSASISNGEYKLQTVISSSEIFKWGLVGLTSSLYHSGSLRTLLETSFDNLKLDLALPPTIFKEDLDFLHGILSSYLYKREKFIEDVSVYDLLKENWPFEISHLFGWQSSNNLKTSDSFKDLPYFSHVDLVKKFGHCQELEYTFYIRQGRPLFAYLKFVTYCASTYGKVALSQINQACNEAHSIAIENVCLPSVTASSVAFMELLNCNSQGLRIELEIYQLIMWHQNREKAKSMTGSQHIDVESLFETELATLLEGGIYGQHDKLLVVLNWAEESMLEYLAVNEIESSSMDAFYHWSLLNLFCQRHGLTYSVTFLKSCIESENWIMFLLFAEVFQYSRDQVCNIVDLHGRGEVAVHLKNVLCQLRYHSLSNVYKRLQATVDISKNVRANLYSKFGVSVSARDKIPRQNSDDATDSIIGESSDETTDRSSTSSLSNDLSLTCPVISASSDILGILLQSHQHTNPWQVLLSQAIEFNNPTLAIIAACYQEASYVQCLCVWFLAEVSDQERSHLHSLLKECIDSKSWSLRNLFDVVHHLIKIKFLSVLVLGFHYFLPDSPLYSLFKFMQRFLEEKSYESSVVHLKEFQSSLCNMLNTEWQSLSSSEILLEEFCISIINEVLIGITNRCERVLFLSVLSDVNIEETLGKTGAAVPKYSLLYSLEELLSKTSSEYSLQNLLKPECDVTYSEECRSILNSLVKERQFLIANQFVTLTSYPKYEVILAQTHEEIASRTFFRSAGGLNSILLVWKQYYFQFKESGVPAREASNFFKNYGLAAEDPRERYYIFHLSWLTSTWQSQSGWYDEEVEREMWLARIQAEVESESSSLDLPESLFELQHDDRNRMKTSQQIFRSGIDHPMSITLQQTTDKERNVLEKVIGYELDNGNIDVAYRLTLLFNHKCISLSAILTCMQLAEGVITEDEIDDRLQEELSRRKSRSPSKSFDSKVPPLFPTNMMARRSESTESDVKASLIRQASSGSTTSEHGEILKLMKTFVDVCKVGALSLNRVITFYKLSMVLKEDYEEIVSWDNSKILESVLQTDDVKRFALAKDFVLCVDFDDGYLASFLCDHIVKVLNTFVGNTVGNCHSNRESISSPADASAMVLQLAKLCEDPSSLGKCLLERVATQRHETYVELCICSHNCFTLACHVGGITKTLQIAKLLARHLASAREYSLMVRLLTGMGRFSEMPYIFDILRNHHRFELLFKKGMEKVPGFKLALLDYMKRFHPNDTEMFTMICLHFRMYREIAETLESLAKSQLENLHLENTSKLTGTRETLEIIMQYLADAAESYVKAECLQQALVCAKQAELVALQIYLHQFDKRVLLLTSGEVTNFIVNNSNFNEAYVVAEAYGHHRDWALALYTNYVVKGDENYFSEFSARIRLSVPLLEEVVRRFAKEAIKPAKMTTNVKHILNLIENVKVKYELADELGFNDISTAMLADQSHLYLQRADLSV